MDDIIRRGENNRALLEKIYANKTASRGELDTADKVFKQLRALKDDLEAKMLEEVDRGTLDADKYFKVLNSWINILQKIDRKLKNGELI